VKPLTDPIQLERAKWRFYQMTKSFNIEDDGVQPGHKWDLGGAIVVYEPETPERFSYYEPDNG